MQVLLMVFFLGITVILLLLLYPGFIWLRSVFFPRPVLKADTHVQPVSIIIACNNEELFIRQKIDSFLSEGEWIEGSEIIVVSNGSTDGTNAILAEYTDNPDIRVFIEQGQGSKIKSVNRGVAEARCELLVFSDCRQVMKKGSVKHLVANFMDPQVGTVNSTLMDPANEHRISLRSFLNFISRCESHSGSSLNVFGALYAQRKSAFREFPSDLLFDDLFVVVSTLLQKKRLVSDKNAVIYDLSFEEYYGQNRIQRLARGLLIFLVNHFGMIRQLPFLTFMRFMIFKYLKLILPFVFIILSLDALFLLYFKSLQSYILAFLLVVFVLGLFEPARRILIHLVKINYNFMIATFQFMFFNNRSNKWDKLKAVKTV
jgi:cellulose synthase/poly-beta-1,6-N-acetylglucosamine synthase-like glycosyltransferase